MFDCTFPAKVRIRLLLEHGSKPQENRLILPDFPFAVFETPPWPSTRGMFHYEQKGLVPKNQINGIRHPTGIRPCQDGGAGKPAGSDAAHSKTARNTWGARHITQRWSKLP
jgi:hypothetical protein